METSDNVSGAQVLGLIAILVLGILVVAGALTIGCRDPEVNTATYELVQSWVDQEPDPITKDWLAFQIGCNVKGDGRITISEFEALSRLRDENKASRIKKTFQALRETGAH